MGMLNLILNIDVFILVDLSNFYKKYIIIRVIFDIFFMFFVFKD